MHDRSDARFVGPFKGANDFIPYQYGGKNFGVLFLYAIDVLCHTCNKTFHIDFNKENIIGSEAICPTCKSSFVLSLEFFDSLLEREGRSQGRLRLASRRKAPNDNISSDHRPLQLSLHFITHGALAWLDERWLKHRRRLNKSYLYEWFLYRYPPFREALKRVNTELPD